MNVADARARVRESGGVDLLERLDHLDAHRNEHAPENDAPPRPELDAATDFDVVIVGGGLWSILAPVLAAGGARVAVFDRSRIGVAHREWNASRPELEALIAAKLFSADELDRLIVARYDHGICRFHGGGTYAVHGALDCAVDAGPLLAHARELAEQRGVSFFDFHSLDSHSSGRTAVRLKFIDKAGQIRTVTSKLMVDARGAASPYATGDLVCPTVGGVLRGLAEGTADTEMNPRVGEILATIDPIEKGRQHVWEAFPGRAGETTVYLFYYARSDENASLAELFARFFATLPNYKHGTAELVRPTFGFIPGWSRLTKAPRPPDPRVVLVGDAAARHSPLTYCGFGATLRSLGPASRSILETLDQRKITLKNVMDDPPVHTLTGALAHMLASRAFEGDSVNELLDAAFRTLHEMGDDAYGALLRDEMRPAAFVEFLRKTAATHPAVWGKIMRGLGLGVVGRWSLGLARTFAASA